MTRGRKVDEYLLKERHAALLEYQHKKTPWIPTMREICAVWYLSPKSWSVVSHALELMAERGWVIMSDGVGRMRQYYAIERKVGQE